MEVIFIENNREYAIGDVSFTISREFSGEKSARELITEIISGRAANGVD